MFSYAPTQSISQPTAAQVTRPTTPARVTREATVKPAYRLGQMVGYSSKRGKFGRYRIARFAKNGRIQLEMVGRYANDRMAGTRFWADRNRIAA